MANEGEDEPATMKDFKEIETSLTSAMDKRMDEMRDMIAKLMSTQASTLSASSALVDTSSEKINSEDDGVENGEANKDDPHKNASPAKEKGGKGDYHAVPPPSYTPDPLIPHPHINNVGAPPKIDATSSFSQWQYLMKSYLCSSCVELWRIIQNGYKPFDPKNFTRREVVDHQLDSMALHILQEVVG